MSANALQRAVAEYQLQELQPDEEEAEGGQELRRDADGTSTELVEREQPRIEQRRLRVTATRARSSSTQRRPRGLAITAKRGAPNLLGAFDDAEHHRADAHSRQRVRRDIEVRVIGIGGVRGEEPRGG